VNKVCSTNDAYDQRMRFLVCKTKGDVFFMMRNRDSVNSYYNQALKLNRESYNAERDVLRLKYYTLMLAGQYEQAIPVIKKALKPTVKYFRHIDRLNLAKSYFKTGNHELALSVIEQVVADSAHAYAFIKIYSYTLLGDIAMSKNRFEEALRYRTLALNESEKNIRNMAKVSDLTSQMRLDKIKTAAETQAAVYKKERTVLVFGLIATALGAVIIGLFYNNIRQRSRYAKLLSDSRDKELTFVNSHKTRKHLANILGFCNLVKESNPEKTELITYFKYVETSAYDMDEWLKEVDRKLKK
jgi:tetratricopeptide (TPR) repeat protein